MRVKRRQEKQNEERYSTRIEAEAEPDLGEVGSSRASQDALEGRRIITASRRRFGGAGTGTMTPSSSSDAPPAPSASSNPFAFTTLARPAATTETKPSLFSFSGGGNNEQPSQSSKPNPFANVVFASNSSTTTTTDASKSLAAPPASLAPPKFSFTSFTATPSGGNPPASSSASQPSSRANKEEMRDLNMTLWQTIVDHWEGKHYVADYSHFMKEYLTHAEEILQREEDGDDETNDRNLPSQGPSSSTLSFSFGTASTTASAPPSTKYSVAGPSSSAPSFSFGASSSAPSTSHVHATSSGNDDDDDDNNDDDPNADPDDGQVDDVKETINLEEDILQEVRAALFKSVNKVWKKTVTGPLLVYRHKVTGKHRMAIKNEYGKLHLNVAVVKGMKFEKVESGKKVYLKFLGVEDESKGRELLMLQVRPEYVDKLHGLLESLTKS